MNRLASLPIAPARRIALLALTCVFFFTQCLFAQLPEKNFWLERQKAISGLKTETSSAQPASVPQLAALPETLRNPPAPGPLLANASFSFAATRSAQSRNSSLSVLVQSLPASCGTIRNISVPAGTRVKRTIIHIQDVHGNSEAQTNIGKTVQELIESGQAGLVALEGAWGPMDFSGFRAYEHKDNLRKAACYVLKENRISGPVQAALTSRKEIPPFTGIDDAVHYEANLSAYRKSEPRLEAYKDEWADMEKKSAFFKKSAFNPKLLAFDSKVEKFHEGALRLGEYLSALQTDSGADRKGTGNIALFLEALGMESRLNFGEVQKERTRLLSHLAQSLDKPALSALLAKSVAYRLGQISHGEFYTALKNLCGKSGADWKQYPGVDAYLRYVILSDRIDMDSLQQEIGQAESRAYASLIKTPREKKLVRESKNLYLIGRLLDFSLTPQEWEEYQQVRKDNPEGLGDLAPFESFYREADVRSRLIAENLLSAMENKNVSVAVLVTGGFHSQKINERLMASGCTIVGFVPRITHAESLGSPAALSIFSQEKTPLEKLFQGEKLFLAPNPAEGLADTAAIAMGLGALETPGESRVDLTQDSRRIFPRAGILEAFADLDRPEERARVTVRKSDNEATLELEENGGEISRVEQKTGSRTAKDFALPILEEILRGLAIGLWGVWGAVIYIGIHAFVHFWVDIYAARGDHLSWTEFLLMRLPARMVFSAAFSISYLVLASGWIPFSWAFLLVPFSAASLVHIFSNTRLHDFMMEHAGWWLTMSVKAKDPAAFRTLLAREIARERAKMRVRPANVARAVPASILNEKNSQMLMLSRETPEQIEVRARALKTALASRPMEEADTAYALALFSEVARRLANGEIPFDEELRPFVGGPPNDEQIQGALLLLDGKIVVRMLPGEGKTLTLGLASYLKALTGVKVEVHGWNNARTTADSQVIGAILDRLGLKTCTILGRQAFEFIREARRNARHTADGTRPHLAVLHQLESRSEFTPMQRAFHEADVVYGPYDRMIFAWMHDWYGLNINSRFHPTAMPEAVFMDEADTPLLDAITDPEASYTHLHNMDDERERLFRIIYGFVSAPERRSYFRNEGDMIHFDRPGRAQEMLDDLVRRLGPARTEVLSEDYELGDLMLGAMEALLLNVPLKDYLVRDHGVILRDSNTYELKLDRRLGRGVHTFLEIKEGTHVQRESHIESVITTQQFYHRISWVAAVTGILDDQSIAELYRLYGFTVEAIPPHPGHDDLRIDLPIRYFPTADKKFDFIADLARRLYAGVQAPERARPNMIDCSPLEVDEIVRRIHALGFLRNESDLRIIDGQHPREGSNLNRIGDPQSISITVGAGRGLEIKIRDEEEMNRPATVEGIEHPVSGLFVTLPHRGVSQRGEDQAKRRTARWGRPGMVQVVDHLKGKPLLEQWAPQELKALLKLLDEGRMSLDDAADTATISQLFELARDRRFNAMLADHDRLENYYDRLLDAHLAFVAAARSVIQESGNAGRLLTRGGQLVHRAFQALQRGQREEFHQILVEFRAAAEALYLPFPLEATPGETLANRLRRIREHFGPTRTAQDVTLKLSKGTAKRWELGSQPGPDNLAAFVELYASRGRHSPMGLMRFLWMETPVQVVERLRGKALHEVIAGLQESRWIEGRAIAQAVGVDKDTYGFWRKGTHRPREAELKELVSFYHHEYGFDETSLQELFGLASSFEQLLTEQSSKQMPQRLKDLRQALGINFTDMATALGMGTNSFLQREKAPYAKPERNVGPHSTAFRRLFANHLILAHGLPLELTYQTLDVPIPAQAIQEIIQQNLSDKDKIKALREKFEIPKLVMMTTLHRSRWDYYDAIESGESAVNHHDRWDLARFLESQYYCPLPALKELLSLRTPEELALHLETTSANLGDCLATLRDLEGLDLAPLAELVRVPRRTYTTWEQEGHRPVSFDPLARIATHYETTFKLPADRIRTILMRAWQTTATTGTPSSAPDEETGPISLIPASDAYERWIAPGWESPLLTLLIGLLPALGMLPFFWSGNLLAGTFAFVSLLAVSGLFWSWLFKKVHDIQTDESGQQIRKVGNAPYLLHGISFGLSSLAGMALAAAQTAGLSIPGISLSLPLLAGIILAAYGILHTGLHYQHNLTRGPAERMSILSVAGRPTKRFLRGTLRGQVTTLAPETILPPSLVPLRKEILASFPPTTQAILQHLEEEAPFVGSKTPLWEGLSPSQNSPLLWAFTGAVLNRNILIWAGHDHWHFRIKGSGGADLESDHPFSIRGAASLNLLGFAGNRTYLVDESRNSLAYARLLKHLSPAPETPRLAITLTVQSIEGAPKKTGPQPMLEALFDMIQMKNELIGRLGIALMFARSQVNERGNIRILREWNPAQVRKLLNEFIDIVQPSRSIGFNETPIRITTLGGIHHRYIPLVSLLQLIHASKPAGDFPSLALLTREIIDNMLSQIFPQYAKPRFPSRPITTELEDLASNYLTAAVRTNHDQAVKTYHDILAGLAVNIGVLWAVGGTTGGEALANRNIGLRWNPEQSKAEAILHDFDDGIFPHPEGPVQFNPDEFDKLLDRDESSLTDSLNELGTIFQIKHQERAKAVKEFMKVVVSTMRQAQKKILGAPSQDVLNPGYLESLRRGVGKLKTPDATRPMGRLVVMELRQGLSEKPNKVPDARKDRSRKGLSLFPDSQTYTRKIAWTESFWTLGLLLWAAGKTFGISAFSGSNLAWAGAVAGVAFLVLHGLLDLVLKSKTPRNWLGMVTGAGLLHLAGLLAIPFLSFLPPSAAYLLGHAVTHFVWNRFFPGSALSLSHDEATGRAEEIDRLLQAGSRTDLAEADRLKMRLLYDMGFRTVVSLLNGENAFPFESLSGVGVDWSEHEFAETLATKGPQYAERFQEIFGLPVDVQQVRENYRGTIQVNFFNTDELMEALAREKSLSPETLVLFHHVGSWFKKARGSDEAESLYAQAVERLIRLLPAGIHIAVMESDEEARQLVSILEATGRAKNVLAEFVGPQAAQILENADSPEGGDLMLRRWISVGGGFRLFQITDAVPSSEKTPGATITGSAPEIFRPAAENEESTSLFPQSSPFQTFPDTREVSPPTMRSLSALPEVDPYDLDRDSMELLAVNLYMLPEFRSRRALDHLNPESAWRDGIRNIARRLATEEGSLSRRRIREILMDSYEGLPRLSPREAARLTRRLFLTGRRLVIDTLRRVILSERIKAELGKAFDERDEERFRAMHERFQKEVGGRIFLTSPEPRPDWGGVSVVDPERAEAAVASVAMAVPDEFPINRIWLKRIMRTVLNTRPTGRDEMGLVMLESIPRVTFLNMSLNNFFNDLERMLVITSHDIQWFNRLGWMLTGTGHGRDTSSYKGPDASLRGRETVINIPLDRQMDSGNPARPGESIQKLDGGSYSSVEVIARSGTTVVRKSSPALELRNNTAIPLEETAGKLRREAQAMAALQAQGSDLVPDILAIKSTSQRTTVWQRNLEEDGMVPLASILFRDVSREVPGRVIFETALNACRRLVDVLYRPTRVATPKDFVEKHHLEKVRSRISQAAERAPNLAPLFNAFYVGVNSLTKSRIIPGYKILEVFIEAVAQTGILDPPFLSETHGDSHLGNMLINPVDFLRYRAFHSIKLIDWNPGKKDWVYELAKIIHSFYGGYEIARLEDMYGYDMVEYATFENLGEFPVVSEHLNDEETNFTPFLITDELIDVFIEWLKNTDDAFGLERGSAWKARLLFTNGTLLLGLAPFHLNSERRATSLYIFGLQCLMEALDHIIEGTFDNDLPAGINPVGEDVKAPWRTLKAALHMALPTGTPARPLRFLKSRIERVREILTWPEPEKNLKAVINDSAAFDMGLSIPAFFGLLSQSLNPTELEALVPAAFKFFYGKSLEDYARNHNLLMASGNRTVPGSPTPVVVVTFSPVVDVAIDTSIMMNAEEKVLVEAGGKGVNMGRAYQTWTGAAPAHLGFLGGTPGALEAGLMERGGMSSGLMTETRSPTRIGLSLHYHGQRLERVFTPAGPITTEELASFRQTFRQAIAGAHALLLAGSLPPGVPADEYGRLITEAKSRNVRTYVDTRGEALRSAIAAVPHFLGINVAELAEYLGVETSALRQNPSVIVAEAEKLVRSGINIVVISADSDGLYAIGQEDGEIRAYQVKPPRVREISAVGAGDTIKVAWAWAEDRHWSLVNTARLAAAAGAITVTKRGNEMSTAEEAQARMQESVVTHLPVSGNMSLLRLFSDAASEEAYEKYIAPGWESPLLALFISLLPVLGTLPFFGPGNFLVGSLVFVALLGGSGLFWSWLFKKAHDIQKDEEGRPVREIGNAPYRVHWISFGLSSLLGLALAVAQTAGLSIPGVALSFPLLAGIFLLAYGLLHTGLHYQHNLTHDSQERMSGKKRKDRPKKDNAPASPRAPEGPAVNVNSEAAASALADLLGVTGIIPDRKNREETVRRIHARQMERGEPYRNIEELAEVVGIGPGRLARIQDEIGFRLEFGPADQPQEQKPEPPSEELEREIPGPGRTFRSPPDAPLSTIVKFTEEAFSLGLTEDDSRNVVNAVSQLSGQWRGRSRYIPGIGQVRLAGHTFPVIKAKAVTVRGGSPTTKLYRALPGEHTQPTHNTRLSAEGRVILEPAHFQPEGGGPLSEAANEFREMRRAFLAGVSTAYPIGIGIFPRLSFQESPGTPAVPMGYVVMATIEREDERLVPQQTFFDLDNDPEHAIEKFTRRTQASLQTLRTLHGSGGIHTQANQHQYRVTEGPGGDVSYLFDFSNADAVQNGRLTRDQFIYEVLHDFSAFHKDLLRGFAYLADPRRPVKIRTSLARSGNLTELINGMMLSYFTTEDIQRYGEAQLRQALGAPGTASFYDLLETPDAEPLIAAHPLTRIFADMAGRTYDRITHTTPALDAARPEPSAPAEAASPQTPFGSTVDIGANLPAPVSAHPLPQTGVPPETVHQPARNHGRVLHVAIMHRDETDSLRYLEDLNAWLNQSRAERRDMAIVLDFTGPAWPYSEDDRPNRTDLLFNLDAAGRPVLTPEAREQWRRHYEEQVGHLRAIIEQGNDLGLTAEAIDRGVGHFIVPFVRWGRAHGVRILLEEPDFDRWMANSWALSRLNRAMDYAQRTGLATEENREHYFSLVGDFVQVGRRDDDARTGPVARRVADVAAQGTNVAFLYGGAHLRAADEIRRLGFEVQAAPSSIRQDDQSMLLQSFATAGSRLSRGDQLSADDLHMTALRAFVVTRLVLAAIRGPTTNNAAVLDLAERIALETNTEEILAFAADIRNGLLAPALANLLERHASIQERTLFHVEDGPFLRLVRRLLNQLDLGDRPAVLQTFQSGTWRWFMLHDSELRLAAHNFLAMCREWWQPAMNLSNIDEAVEQLISHITAARESLGSHPLRTSSRLSLFRGSEHYETQVAPVWESRVLGGIVSLLSAGTVAGALHLFGDLINPSVSIAAVALAGWLTLMVLWGFLVAKAFGALHSLPGINRNAGNGPLDAHAYAMKMTLRSFTFRPGLALSVALIILPASYFWPLIPFATLGLLIYLSEQYTRAHIKFHLDWNQRMPKDEDLKGLEKQNPSETIKEALPPELSSLPMVENLGLREYVWDQELALHKKIVDLAGAEDQFARAEEMPDKLLIPAQRTPKDLNRIQRLVNGTSENQMIYLVVDDNDDEYFRETFRDNAKISVLAQSNAFVGRALGHRILDPRSLESALSHLEETEGKAILGELAVLIPDDMAFDWSKVGRMSILRDIRLFLVTEILSEVCGARVTLEDLEQNYQSALQTAQKA